MAFKFPFTNYHELNLTWILEQLKSLFEQSEENVTIIETYENRLTAVETELPGISETASEASRAAAAAGSLAQTATQKADTAQENAVQAQGMAGTARREAEAAQTAANEATQAAQQAQATAQNFDGRITQAENDASQALEASRSFENRVQSAITTANNAAQTATNAQGIATRADQNAALALDTLNSQRAELERIGAEQVELITEETENGKAEIEALIDTIPADYTALVELVDKKAPVIINSVSGAIASFSDGAGDMKVQKLVVNIEPVQAGSGDPSPDNVRPISGWTGANIYHEIEYNAGASPLISITWESETGTVYSGTLDVISGVLTVNKKIVLVSELPWNKTSDDIYYAVLQDAVTIVAPPYSNRRTGLVTSAYSASITTGVSSADMQDKAWLRNGLTVYIRDSRFPDAASFKSAMGNVQLLYDLAQPITYQLTPQELVVFYEINNIWSNVGSVFVDYPADTKLYIDNKIAELQSLILEH